MQVPPWADPEGGTEGPDPPPPGNSQVLYWYGPPPCAYPESFVRSNFDKVFFSKFDEGGGEDQNITFSIKWRFAGVPMIALH